MKTFSFNFRNGVTNIPSEKIVDYKDLEVIDCDFIGPDGNPRIRRMLSKENFKKFASEGKIFWIAEIYTYHFLKNITIIPITIVRMEDGSLELINYTYERMMNITNINMNHNNFKTIPYDEILPFDKRPYVVFTNTEDLVKYYNSRYKNSNQITWGHIDTIKDFI